MGQGERCSQCDKYTLSVLRRRQVKHVNSELSRADPSSHANPCFLNTPEKVEHLRRLHHKSRVALRKVNHLEAMLSEVISQQAVEVDEEVATDLSSIVAEENDQVEKSFLRDRFIGFSGSSKRKLTRGRTVEA